MRQITKKVSILVLSGLFIQCANIYEPLAPKDSNEALLYEAKDKIDHGLYVDAISFLDKLDPTFSAQNDVRITHASAYAGACGMEFIPFFTNISQATITPPNTLFKFLRSSFTDKSATPSYCTLAESKIKEIGATEALRLAAMEGKKEVNMLMAILSMAKIGAILRTKSDVDGTNLLGDGTTDAGFTACNSSMLSDDDVLEIGVGFKLLIENLPSVLGATNTLSTALDTLTTTVIGAFCGLVPTTKCVALDRAEIDPADQAEFIDTYRDLLETQTAGIGSCVLLLPDSCCP